MSDLSTFTTNGGARFTTAAEHASRFRDLLNDLEAAGYPVKGDQSGGYNYRNIAGTNKLSEHATGRAVDVNWTDNPRGGAGSIPPELARSLAEKYGMTWGGDWKNPDPMHFEIGPAPWNPTGNTNIAAGESAPTTLPTTQTGAETNPSDEFTGLPTEIRRALALAAGQRAQDDPTTADGSATRFGSLSAGQDQQLAAADDVQPLARLRRPIDLGKLRSALGRHSLGTGRV